MTRRLLPVAEAATYVSLSDSTLNRLRVGGGGPHYVKLAGRVLYDVREYPGLHAPERKSARFIVDSDSSWAAMLGMRATIGGQDFIVDSWQSFDHARTQWVAAESPTWIHNAQPP